MVPLMMQNMAAPQMGGIPQQSLLLQALYGQLANGNQSAPPQMQGAISGTESPQFRPVQQMPQRPNWQPGGLGVQPTEPSPWTDSFQGISGQQMPNGGPLVPNHLLNRPLR